MKKGFTLIELLIVIAILAALATAVVLVLNPAELIKQARDSTRISDIAALNHAIALFLADQTSPTWTATAATCTSNAGPGAPSSTATSTCATVSTGTTVDGTGWVPVNFGAISTGSPLPRLPMDPNNGSANCAGTPNVCAYVYKSLSTVGRYKLFANMESAKYGTGGASDVESNTDDGGNSNTWYEIGSSLTNF